MAKDNDIIINRWDIGIGVSPHRGFHDMRNLDIDSIPGVVRAQLECGSINTAPTDTPMWITRDPRTGDYFAVGSTGIVYKKTSAGGWSTVSGYSTTNAHGEGLAVFQDYLYVARQTKLDKYGPLSSSPAWTLDWQTLSGQTTGGYYHPMVVSQTLDVLLIGSGRYVDKVTSSSSFTANVLDLPTDVNIKCMRELRGKLYAGTYMGGDSTGALIRFAKIYPWDLTTTPSSYNEPIDIPDYGVHQMEVVDDILFVTCGLRGSIYYYNGTTAKPIRDLPAHVISLLGSQYVTFYPGAVMSHRHKYYFGVSKGSNNTGLEGIGVWSLGVNGALNFDRQIATGTMTTTANSLQVASLYPAGHDDYWYGSRDNTTYAFNQAASGSNGFTNYEAYGISPVIKVGTKLNPRTLTQVEFDLDRQLSSNQGIKLAYRKSLADSFTDIGTYDYATYGAIRSYAGDALITDAEILQIKFSIKEAGTTRIGLREIRLR